MQATYILFPEKNHVSVERETLPDSPLEPLEVLVRNETSIVSAGTELARLSGLEQATSFPLRPGYGCIGRIEAQGAGVTDFKIGQRVFYAGKHASVNRFKHGQDHQWGRLYPVPEGLDPVDGVVGCMAQIAMTAPNVTQLHLGDRVAVFGLGLVGNLAAQLYALRGANVLALDPVPARCAQARACGLADAVEAPPAEQVAAVKRYAGEEGAAVCVDAVGHSAVIQQAVAACAPFGQVVLLGTPRAPHQADLTPMLLDIHRKGLVVRGAHMWRLPAVPARGMKQDVAWAFATIFGLLRDGKLIVRPLLSHVVKPDAVPAAYRGLQHEKDRYTGVVIDWREA